jgi:hypothetical protein
MIDKEVPFEERCRLMEEDLDKAGVDFRLN